MSDAPATITTEQGYALWAASYDTFDNPVVAMAAHALDRTPPSVAGQRVLELGCGTGRNLHELIARGAREYVGLDSSEAMLKRARERSGPLGDRVRLIASDVSSLPETLGPFEFVLVCLVLEHISDIGAVFRAAASVTPSGGVLRIIELHPSLYDRGKRAHVDTAEGPRYLPSYRHDAEQIALDLERNGWDASSVTSWQVTSALAAKSEKLARYRGHPVVLDIVAERRSSADGGIEAPAH